MTRLSWTQLSMHERCPYEWYMKYVKRVVPYVRNIHFTVGSATHRAIEVALKNWELSRKTVLELVGVYVKYLIGEGVNDPDQLTYWRMSGQNMLMGWQSWAAQHEIEVIKTEQKLTKDRFAGVVDCIANIDGQLYIIDWKTSSKRYTQKQVDTDGQVTAYMWLTGRHDAKVAYGVLQKGTGHFQFLPSTRDVSDIAVFVERVAKMRSEISEYKETAPKITGSHCDRCDLYPNLCEGTDDF